MLLDNRYSIQKTSIRVQIWSPNFRNCQGINHHLYVSVYSVWPPVFSSSWVQKKVRCQHLGQPTLLNSKCLSPLQFKKLHTHTHLFIYLFIFIYLYFLFIYYYFDSFIRYVESSRSWLCRLLQKSLVVFWIRTMRKMAFRKCWRR